MPATGDRDKAIFYSMMGCCLLALSIGPFYWAVYTHRYYAPSVEVLETLRSSPVDGLTSTQLEERRSRIVVETGTVSNRRIEMIASVALGLLLFGIALFLFRKALSERAVRIYYVDIDPRTIPRPESAITVHSTRFQGILLGGLAVFFGLMSILVFRQTLNNQFMSSGQVMSFRAISICLILLLVVIFCLMVRAKRNSVRIIDAVGITRGDGLQLSWGEFVGVVNKVGRNRYGGNFVWRQELMFTNDRAAWLIPQRIKNGTEVYSFVNALPAAVVRD